MNYEEARVYLEEASKYGSVLGLDNMRHLMERLGNPQDSLKFIIFQELTERVLSWLIFLPY